MQDNVIKFFSTFDESIKGFNVEKVDSNDDNKDKYTVETLHKIINSDEYTNIPLKFESSGTLKMLTLYEPISNVLEHGSTLSLMN